MAQGHSNGVEGLEMIGGNAARAMEPELFCIGALHSPESGIIDSHGYMLALWGELEDRGGMHRVRDAGRAAWRFTGSQWQVHVRRPRAGIVAFDAVINCAGLGAQAAGARASRAIRPTRCRRSSSPRAITSPLPASAVFARLIYPTPVDGGLGVHVTLDLAGRMRFGPDVEWIDHESYTRRSAPRGRASTTASARYWPGLPDGALVPDYCGIRPEADRTRRTAGRFHDRRPSRRTACRGLVNLFGIESPGLTSSLSLAEEVVDYLAA